jgi:hypothetical protein
MCSVVCVPNLSVHIKSLLVRRYSGTGAWYVGSYAEILRIHQTVTRL